MALPATIRRFEIDLSDVDAGIYETVSLRVAQHPSETNTYLLTRVIAYLLNISEGVELSKAGLCKADEPPLASHDLTGKMQLWIDIGLPAPERIHKASKQAQKVVIYTHKTLERVREKLNTKLIYRAAEVRIYPLDPDALEHLESSLDRVNKWSVLYSDGVLFITIGTDTTSLEVQGFHIEQPGAA